ncbi:hypothetical protein Hamer_G005198 [Homarus americanus]|uniref:Uncharacterized protein n=1 Tax=Homarus americanus TaxID=6706 RepID=A0A8J5JZP7_HOMAM|nr:hypothetical protein Hamer_G005198 [Homarus americanus]
MSSIMGQGSIPGKTLRSSHLPPTRTRQEIPEELRTVPIQGTRLWTRKHCSLLAELDVTGEGDRSEDVTEVAAPREDSEDIPSTSAAAVEKEETYQVSGFSAAKSPEPGVGAVGPVGGGGGVTGLQTVPDPPGRQRTNDDQKSPPPPLLNAAPEATPDVTTAHAPPTKRPTRTRRTLMHLQDYVP